MCVTQNDIYAAFFFPTLPSLRRKHVIVLVFDLCYDDECVFVREFSLVRISKKNIFNGVMSVLNFFSRYR